MPTFARSLGAPSLPGPWVFPLFVLAMVALAGCLSDLDGEYRGMALPHGWTVEVIQYGDGSDRFEALTQNISVTAERQVWQVRLHHLVVVDEGPLHATLEVTAPNGTVFIGLGPDQREYPTRSDAPVIHSVEATNRTLPLAIIWTNDDQECTPPGSACSVDVGVQVHAGRWLHPESTPH